MTDGTNPVIEPCPFCGEQELTKRPENERGEYAPKKQVVCYGCGASGPIRGAAGQRADAIERWNTRAAPPANPVIVERVARALDPELFCGDERREHRRASPLTVEAAKNRVREKAQAALEAMPDVVGLREALEPFAAFASLPGANYLPDDHVVSLGTGLAAKQLTMGDCRTALAALAKVSGVSK